MELKKPALTVTVLGSSGSYATPDNPCTSFLLRSPTTSVLLDCGPGSTGPLQSHIDPADLTAIVISHCHPDHWIELPVLRNVFTYFHPVDRMPVYGTARTRTMDQAVHARHGDVADPIDWTVIDESSRISIGDMEFSFSRTDHPVETLAARVDVAGRSFAFSSDTGPGWQLGSLGHGIDFVIHEASHLSDSEGLGIPHTSARQAGESARRASAGRLALTHLMPGSDEVAHLAEATEAFGGPVVLAAPGSVFDISTPETS